MYTQALNNFVAKHPNTDHATCSGAEMHAPTRIAQLELLAQQGHYWPLKPLEIGKIAKEQIGCPGKAITNEW